MSYAQVLSRAAVGLDAPLVRVEVHLSGGLPSYTLVGLPATAVRESKQRVKGALQSSGFDMPRSQIVVNLAPADLPKEGGRFDLAIALGLLLASNQLKVDTNIRLEDAEFVGELGLNGAIRGVRGVLPAIKAAADTGRRVFMPADNACEASCLRSAEIVSVESLAALAAHLQGETVLQEVVYRQPPPRPAECDLSDVKQQPLARRAIEVAAAGAHNVLLAGPPGTGKTLLANRLVGLLPDLSIEESEEVAAMASVSDAGFAADKWGCRPFRAPHHTASAIALVGGGNHPRPGEISLAHHGVLFLDELPEFDRRVLEVLREPLESGGMTVSRAHYKVFFPARFQLVAAMNPCPCGFASDPSGRCRCSPAQIARYRQRLSGPLLDRIDIHIEMPRESLRDLRNAPAGESTADVRARVIHARTIQRARQRVTNAALAPAELERHCPVGAELMAVIEAAQERYALSMRAYHRLLKVTRTIADLAGAEDIAEPHLLEALGYRPLDMTA